jgi:NitT/TauT family transport system ATP-binding protein
MRGQGSVASSAKPLLAPHPRAALVFQQPACCRGSTCAATSASASTSRASRRSSVRGAQAARRAMRSPRSAWPARACLPVRSCRAARPSAWRWPAPWRASRNCCSPTNRFSALDAITRAACRTLLVELVHRWHTAALLVTHDIDEAILVGDRILLMAGQPGRIVREWRVDIPRTAPLHRMRSTSCALHAATSSARLRDGHSFLKAITTMDRYDRPPSPHVCASSACDCGMTRRDFLRMSALAGAGVAAPAAVRRRRPGPALQGRRPAREDRLPADHRRRAAAGGARRASCSRPRA